MKMLKCLVMAMVCSLAYLASADNLERFVPEDTRIMGRLRPRMALELSALKGDDAEAKSWRETIEAYNIFGGGSLPAKVLVIYNPARFGNGPVVIVPVTNTPEEMRAKLEKLTLDFPDVIKLGELPNKDYIGFRLIVNNKNPIEIYYLDKDAVALTNGSFAPAELKAGEKPAPILEHFKDSGELEVIRISSMGAGFIPSELFGRSLNATTLKLSKGADEKTAFLLNGILEFDKPETAAQSSFLIPLVLGAVIMQATDDAWLVEQISKKLKVYPEGNKVMIDLPVSETLLKALKEKYQSQIPGATANGNPVAKTEVIEIKPVENTPAAR